MSMNNVMISNDKEEKNEIKGIPSYKEEIPINDKLLDLDERVIQTTQSQNGKNVKFCPNNISVIPISQSYNLRYASNTNTYNDLNDNIKDIINDPKYNNSENRSKSAYSKKSFREKFESMKLKVPEVKNWNCDPTAEIIIHNLEQKIDILTYENFLLTKKIKELVNNNNSLQLDLNHKILLLRTEQQINEENLKNSQNNNISDLNSNLNNKKNIKKDKNKKLEKDKDVDLYENLKDENEKLKKSNENLAENNMKLNKLIDELKKEIKLNQTKYEEELEKTKILYEKELKEQNEQNENNKLMFEQKLLEQNEYYKKILEKKVSEQNENTNNINNINIDIDNRKNENLNDNNNDNAKIEDNNDSIFDKNKNFWSEEKLKNLIEENEKLHKELRVLLGIDGDDDYNYSSLFKDNQNFFFSPIQQSNKKKDKFNEMKKDIKNIDININNVQYSEDIVKENYFLKQKVKSLTTELNKVLIEQNQKLLKIQKKFNEYELKNKNNTTIEKANIEFNEIDKNKEEELDKILNDALILNINPEDEETKKMISTIENIKNNQQKRISKCLVIYNKLKSLSEENYLLHNQMSTKQKEVKNKNIINMNNNLPENNLYLNSTIKPHLCYCASGHHESYDYLINALKIKDEIIMKYREQNEDNENKYKQLIIENSKLKESNERDNINNADNGNVNYVQKDIKINTMRRSRAGLEDYLLDKIVNNQKEVLGERAPRFDDDNYNQYMSKSMQYDGINNNRMNNRYSNNYHYREKRMTNY